MFNCLDINKEYADGASPIAFKAEFVLSLFEQVMGKDGIDAIQKSIVDRCLTNVYKNYIKRGYAHCSALHVSAGQTVKQGQVIADCGSTGYSTGPHCHFEVIQNGVRVDALMFYKTK